MNFQDKYAVLWTNGDLTHKEIIKECPEGKFVPLLVHYEKEKPTLIVFENYVIATSFLKRNVPKNWPKALYQIGINTYQYLIDQNQFFFEVWDFPKKIAKINTGFEIVFTPDEPEVYKMML